MGLINSIKEALKGKHFNIAVDLGCGPGRFGEILKQHVNYLIGVDRHPGRISVAQKFSRYDEVILSDVLDYELPSETEAVFIFEFIEHLSKEDGCKLLNCISYVPFIIISTPLTFFIAGAMNHHLSLWTPEEFTDLGYKVEIIPYDFPMSIPLLRRIDCIFAVKGGEQS